MTCEVPCPWRKAEEPSVETVVYQRTSVPCAETSPTARGADKSTDINYDSEQQFMCDDDCDSLSPQMSSASGHTSGDTNMQLASFYMWVNISWRGLERWKTAKQHVTQVTSIMYSCGNQTMPSLWQHSLLNNFKAFADERQFLPPTIRSYLNSLQHLFKYLLTSGWVVGCWCGYLSGVRCRFAYGPADTTATHCLLLQ